MHVFLLCCYFVLIQVIFDVHARFSAQKSAMGSCEGMSLTRSEDFGRILNSLKTDR